MIALVIVGGGGGDRGPSPGCGRDHHYCGAAADYCFPLWFAAGSRPHPSHTERQYDN